MPIAFATARITVDLIDSLRNRIEIEGVILDLTLYTGGIERYSFDAGSTDVRGRCVIEGSYILNQWEMNRQTFLMDYNTAIEDCEKMFGISIPTLNELEKRLKAIQDLFPSEYSLWRDRMQNCANDRVSGVLQRFPLNSSNETVEYICSCNGQLPS
jgi:hypothetical protein